MGILSLIGKSMKRKQVQLALVGTAAAMYAYYTPSYTPAASSSSTAAYVPTQQPATVATSQPALPATSGERDPILKDLEKEVESYREKTRNMIRTIRNSDPAAASCKATWAGSELAKLLPSSKDPTLGMHDYTQLKQDLNTATSEYYSVVNALTKEPACKAFLASQGNDAQSIVAAPQTGEACHKNADGSEECTILRAAASTGVQ